MGENPEECHSARIGHSLLGNPFGHFSHVLISQERDLIGADAPPESFTMEYVDQDCGWGYYESSALTDLPFWSLLRLFSGKNVLLWRRGANVLTAASIMVTRDERLRLVDGYNLEIADLEPQDAGDYVCQISDKVNRDQIHTVEILGKRVLC